MCVCVLIHLLPWQSHLLFSGQSFAQNAELILQGCHLHCNHTTSFTGVHLAVLPCMLMEFEVFVCVPGNDEGSTCACLNSSCADSTRGSNARRRSHGQTVDICVNAYCTALPVFSAHVHQHYNIPKVQSSIICHTEIHLSTWTNTIIISITIITVILLLLMVLLNSSNSFYRFQNVLSEEVHFLARKLAPLFFLQIFFLCILEKHQHNINNVYFFNMSPPLLGCIL